MTMIDAGHLMNLLTVITAYFSIGLIMGTVAVTLVRRGRVSAHARRIFFWDSVFIWPLMLIVLGIEFYKKSTKI
jgi:hypothetical protein